MHTGRDLQPGRRARNERQAASLALLIARSPRHPPLYPHAATGRRAIMFPETGEVSADGRARVSNPKRDAVLQARRNLNEPSSASGNDRRSPYSEAAPLAPYFESGAVGQKRQPILSRRACLPLVEADIQRGRRHLKVRALQVDRRPAEKVGEPVAAEQREAGIMYSTVARPIYRRKSFDLFWCP